METTYKTSGKIMKCSYQYKNSNICFGISSAIINKRSIKSVFLLINVIMLLFSTSTESFSQQSGGGYAGSWTARDFSARPLAMAGVFTAIADDPNAIYYNPAGLSNLPQTPTFVSSVGFLGLGRTNSTFAWGQEVLPGLGVGIALNNLYTGSFIARDEHGHAFGEYSNYQYAIAASASYKIAYASFGATVKYLTDNLQGSETFANGYTIDFGALFDVLNIFKLGVQLQNASGFLFWNTTRSDIMSLPWKIRVGASTQIYTNVNYTQDRSTTTGEFVTEEIDFGNFLTVGLDVSYSQYSVAPVIGLAAEYAAHKYLTFRGGMAIYGDNYGEPKLFPMNNWGAGLSIYPDIQLIDDSIPFTLSIDYSISKELINTNGINHSLALIINF